MIGNPGGMTLTEVLITIFIITIGLVAVATGMQLATVSINLGQQETTATFLAEEKLEDVKTFALGTLGTQGFANVASANFPVEAYGTIDELNAAIGMARAQAAAGAAFGGFIRRQRAALAGINMRAMLGNGALPLGL